MSSGLAREWRPPFRLDLPGVLAPLRRGRGDPTWHGGGLGAADAAIWRTGTTPDGPATLRLCRRADGTVLADAWGAGAAWTLDGLPALLGADDRPEGFVAHHPLVADAARRLPGVRFGATRRVWDVLVPAILEQKVTGVEARRSWRELCRRFGQAPPGPAPEGMRIPPTPAQVRAIPDWEWHRAGVDLARRRAILGCAAVAHRLEAACELGGEDGRILLRRVPGIGVWTAAEVAQRAWADPDAVSFGDFHIPTLVGWALVGRPLDDAGMLAVLAPYSPQRARAVRYVELSGFRRPRFGPRFSPRDHRAI
ncbi:MAG TPA: DNA-3-methyladenine glycosylase 2 family protein [Pseudonocardia sp.]|nr:DNA-3-methyladenine glycosylase 2 family protein [Pseudonocardia sp.]